MLVYFLMKAINNYHNAVIIIYCSKLTIGFRILFDKSFLLIAENLGASVYQPFGNIFINFFSFLRACILSYSKTKLSYNQDERITTFARYNRVLTVIKLRFHMYKKICKTSVTLLKLAE